MYTGQVNFGELSVTESLTAAIEFARTADLYGVTGMEVQIAEHIKALINNSSPPYGYEFDSNTYLINLKHITSAVHLPQAHPVREILAAALVRGYFREDEHKFVKESREILGFSSNLLEVVKSALKTLSKGSYEASITDPISGKKIWLKWTIFMSTSMAGYCTEIYHED